MTVLEVEGAIVGILKTLGEINDAYSCYYMNTRKIPHQEWTEVVRALDGFFKAHKECLADLEKKWNRGFIVPPPGI